MNTTTASPGATVAEIFAEYIADISFGNLPKSVVGRTKELILDQAGCLLIGSTMPWARIALKCTEQSGGRPEASVINHGLKLPVAEAAFLNATFGHGCELDDHMDSGGGHPGCLTVPVALALGEWLGSTGEELIEAIVVGYDIEWRLGRVMMPTLKENGFHAQSTIGCFAATATAGKLLRLNAAQMAHAFAIAGSHASGIREYDQSGGAVKRLHAGIAARAGVHSARLAGGGLTGPLTVFEGRHGFVRSFSPQSDPGQLLDGVDRQDFGVLHIEIKSYPANINHQAPIGFLREILNERDLVVQDIEKIEIGLKGKTSPIHAGAIRHPHDALGAQFSLPFSVGLRLTKGSNDMSMYMDPEMWNDPEILHVSENLVHLYTDRRLAGLRDGHGSYLTITLKDGTTIERHAAHQKGNPKNPLTRDELISKFRWLAEPVIGESGCKTVIDAVDRCEDTSDISELSKAMA